MTGWSAASEVPREASRTYRDKVAPLLTPRAEAIKWDGKEVEKDAPGVTLLQETLHYVDAQGRRIVAVQEVYKAFTDAGAKVMAEDIESFRRSQQKIAIIEAETIQPDGTSQEVKDDALLLQSPQRQADYALYDEVAEVKTIFPNVKAGSIVRLVVVTEDTIARMPGEYTALMPWLGGWPKQHKRFLVDLPDELAARLQLNVLGDVPVPVRSTPAKGRTRFVWEQQHIPMGDRDIDAAPATQFGPATHLSTIARWDDVGRWFTGMTAGRDELSPKLAAQVDAWTKDAKTPAEILRILFSKVADDVRYTGLELGTADYQPHDCNAVWDNQYGDCKDKANLLVAMLRHKKQTAWVALLNTTHAGLIDRRSPDFRVFTHAITAVPDGKGGYLFCDPTIAHAVPGMLAGGDIDRDILVVREEGAEWARTPAVDAGTADCRFDLRLKPTGELGGWLTFTSSGYYGAYYLDHYLKLEEIEGKRTMQEFLRGFYPGAELVDFVKPAHPSADEPYVLKAFFTIRAQTENGARRQTVVFPDCRPWLPKVGSTPERETPFFQYLEKLRFSCRIQVPAGLQPATLHPAYYNAAAGTTARASWTFADGVCQGDFSLEVGRALVSAMDFPTYYQSLQGLQSWLSQPLVLQASGAAALVAPSAPDLAEEFPLMPSVDGQFNLLEKLFPPNGNTERRRAAFERVLQYFPHDKTAAFRAGMGLALLDVESGQDATALDRMRLLLSTYRQEVRAETLIWAQGMYAYALDRKGDPAAGQAVLAEIAANRAVAEDLRARVLLSCSELLLRHPAPSTADLLRQMARWHTGVQPQLYLLWAHASLQLDRGADLRSDLDEAVRAGAGPAAELFEQIGRAALWAPDKESYARQRQIFELLGQYAGKLGAGYAERLARLRSQSGGRQRLLDLQAKLQARLAEKALSEQFPRPDGTLAAAADYEREITAANAAQNFERYLLLSVQELVACEADDYFGPRYWRAAAYAELRERLAGRALDEPVLLLLLELGDDLPADLPAYLEVQLLRAAHLDRKREFNAEQKLLQGLLAQPGLPRPRLLLALGRSHESGGDLQAALKTYRQLEANASAAPEAVSGLLRAVFLRLHYYQFAEARDLLLKLGALDPALRARAEGAAQLEELIDLARHSDAEAFWRLEGAWWPRWETLANTLSLTPPADPAPVIIDLASWGSAYGSAWRANNRPLVYQQLRTLVTAARWLPSATAELAGVLETMSGLDPGRAYAYSQLGQAVCTPPLEGPNQLQFRRQLLLASFDFNLQQSAAGLAILRSLRAKPLPTEPALRQAYNRIWGLLATAANEECAEAAAALAADLPAMPPSPIRAGAVGILSDLYDRLGRVTEHRELLTRELKSADVKANPQLTNALTARLDKLEFKSVPLSRFPVPDTSAKPAPRLSLSKTPAPDAKVQAKTKGVSPELQKLLDATPVQSPAPAVAETTPAPDSPPAGAVLAFPDIRPPWFEFVGPADLNDPRLGQLETVLRQPGNFLTPAELLKTHLLIVQDPGQPRPQREASAEFAIYQLLDVMPSLEDRRRLVRDIAGSPSCPPDLRQWILLQAALRSCLDEDDEEFQDYASRFTQVALSDEDRKDIGFLARWPSATKAPVSEFCELARDIAGNQPRPYRLGLLHALGRFLLQRGDIKGLREYVKALDPYVSSVAVNGYSMANVQLTLTRDARQAEALQPLHQALRTLALARFPEASGALPAAYRGYGMSAGEVIIAGQADTLALCLHRLRTGCFERTSLGFWRTLLRNLPRGEPTNAFTTQFCIQALALAPTDEVRAQVVTQLVMAADLDDPALRQSLFAALASYRKADAPLTFAQIRILEVRLALRAGEPVNVDTALARLDSPGADAAHAYIRLRHYVQQGDKARLGPLLDNLDANLLQSPALLALALPAYDLLGRQDEAEQARNLLRRTQRQLVSTSWVLGNAEAGSAAAHLALVLNDSSLLPEGWLSFVEVRMLDQVRRTEILTTAALLRSDWPRLLQATEAGLRDQPTIYHLYWLKGLALTKLGRSAEAVGPLRLYLEYSRDELEYPEAKALLEKITSAH